MFGIGLANVFNPGACSLQQASKSLCYFHVWAHILIVRVVTWFPVVNLWCSVVYGYQSNKTAENNDQRRVWGCIEQWQARHARLVLDIVRANRGQ